MDKQSLRASTDTNSLRNSYRSISRSGFIQTLAQQNDTDMKKSRIYNLPSYKKIDLSSRLDMVVVFQAIEITRLSQEIQTLRVALMDSQRQINNYRNYEIQIRELNEKVCQYEEQRLQYQEEIEKLNLICQQLYADLEKEKDENSQVNESGRVLAQELKKEKEKSLELSQTVQKWKNRLLALQKSKQAQLQELKLAMQTQRKSVLNRQITQLTTKFTTQIKSLQKEIYNLRENLASQKQSQKQLKAQLSKRQIELENLTLLKGQIKEYESRFYQIQNEFLKLNDLLRKKEEQHQKFREQEKRLNGKVKEYERKLEKQFKQKLKDYQALQKSHKQLKEKCIRIELQNQQLIDGQLKTNKLENLLNEAGKQIDRLNIIIKNKIKHIEDLNQKYNLLSIKFNELQQTKDNQVVKLENTLLQKQKELTRLGLSAKNRLEQIQGLKDKNSKIQKRLNQSSTQLKVQNQQLKEKKDLLTIRLKQLQQDILQLQQQNKQLKCLKQQLNKYKQEIQPHYKKQLHSLTMTIKQKDQQNNMLGKKLQNIRKSTQVNNESLKEQIQAFKKKNNHLIKLTDELHSKIMDKVKEIKVFKDSITKIDKRVAQCQIVEKKLANNIQEKEKLFSDIDNLQQQNNKLFQKHMQTENKLQSAQKQLFEKAQQTSLLMNQLKYLSEEKVIISQELEQINSQLKASYERERIELQKNKEMERVNYELDQKVKLINQRLVKKEKENFSTEQQCNMQINRLKEETQKYKQRNEQLQQQLQTLKIEIKKIQSLKQSQKRQYQSTINTYKSQNQKLTLQSTRQLTLIQNQLKSQLQHHKSSYAKQKQANQALEVKLKQSIQAGNKLEQKNKKIIGKTSQLQQDIKRYEQKVANLEKQLRRKKSQIDQINQILQDKQQKGQKQKKSVRNTIEIKEQQYQKLKRLYQKQKLKSSQEINLLQSQKQKLLKQISKHREQSSNLTEQLQKALSEGRNSNKFLQQFNKIKLQSQTINEFIQQITSQYFIISSSNSSASHQLYIEHQLKTIKEIVQQNIKVYTQTAKTYQDKIKELIEKNQKQLQEFNQLKQHNTKLKDQLIMLESKHKMLQYENQQNLQKLKQNDKRLIRDELIITPQQTSILSPTSKSPITQKRNISTLFQSMVNSSSIIQPSFTKESKQLETKDKTSKASGIRSMKNLITPFGTAQTLSPKTKISGQMVESTVFEIQGDGKSSEYFNRFKK